MKAARAVVVVLAAALAAACASGGTATPSGPAGHSAGSQPVATPLVSGPGRKHRRHRRHHRRPSPPVRPHPPAASPAAACPAPGRTLAGVYHPSRLVILARCRYAAGTVMDVRHEVDGDLHVIVRLDRRYRSMLNGENYAQQHGGLVVEFMARDGGHLPEPATGVRLALVGAWVLDTEHGWRELHPVFWLRMGGRTYRSGPRFGGSPAGDFSTTAAEDCRTPRGRRCRGYGGLAVSGGGGGVVAAAGAAPARPATRRAW